MKKYINTLLALLVAGTFAGCGSSNDTKVTEETNTTTSEVPKEETPVATEAQPKEQKQKMPTCYIKKGTPVTDNMITVHVKCKNGNIPIDEATVTLDNRVEAVAYKGTYFSDYIGFRNLQSSTSYKAVLEVVVGGKTIKKSVKIKTKEENVEVTPTPIPVVHTAPKWKKTVYKIYRGLADTNNKINLDLKHELSSKQGDIITFKILSNSYKILDDRTCLQDHPFVESKSIQIDGNDLIVKYTPPCIGVITSVVEAKSIGGTSNTTVKVNFKLTPWMPTPLHPYCTQDIYDLHIRSINIPSDNTILSLNKLCTSEDKKRLDFKIISSNFKLATIVNLTDDITNPDKGYNFEDALSIVNGKLKLSKMPFNGGDGNVKVRIQNEELYSDISINMYLESLYLP